MTGEPELDAATGELYAHPPTEFVARRNELAKQTRESGDRELANQIKGLRRPSVGAWYLNTAARASLTSLRELMNLGEQLRVAQAGGDFVGLRELAGRRGQLVTRVVRDLTAHLAQTGVTATPGGLDEVRTTLAGALADPGIADELMRGRLDGPRSYSGFGEMAFGAPVTETTSPQPSPGPAADEPDDSTRRAIAEQELQAAETELTGSTARREAAEAEVRAARERFESLAAELDQAQDRLESAEAVLTEAAEQEHLDSERVERARGRLRP